jgi:hypothetical protein
MAGRPVCDTRFVSITLAGDTLKTAGYSRNKTKETKHNETVYTIR